MGSSQQRLLQQQQQKQGPAAGRNQAVGNTRNARLRCRWFLVGRFVLSVLQARRGWASLGRRLQVFKGLVDHLERKQGTLQHKLAKAKLQGN